MNHTQGQAILRYLRKHRRGTSWQLSQASGSLHVHKRIAEQLADGWERLQDEPGEVALLKSGGGILRRPVRKGRVWVTEYSLVKV